MDAFKSSSDEAKRLAKRLGQAHDVIFSIFGDEGGGGRVGICPSRHQPPTPDSLEGKTGWVSPTGATVSHCRLLETYEQLNPEIKPTEETQTEAVSEKSSVRDTCLRWSTY